MAELNGRPPCELGLCPRGVDEQGRPIEVVDRWATSRGIAQRNREDPFIANRAIFGNLVDDDRFVTAYRSALVSLHEHGARVTLESVS